MDFQFSTTIVSTFLYAVATGSLALIIYLGSKNLSSRLFVAFIISAAAWMTSTGLFQAAINIPTATFWNRSSYVLGAVIVAFFYFFCLSFPEDKIIAKKWAIWWVIISLIVISFLMMGTNLVVGDVYATSYSPELLWAWSFGPVWFLFDLFFDGLLVVGLWILYKKSRRLPEGLPKTRLRYMFWTMIIAFVPPLLTNIVLPRLGSFSLQSIGVLSGFGWILMVAYSIARYRQMNVRVIASEWFVVVMILILFANIFISGLTVGVIGRVFVFIAFVALSYILVKSIFKETYQKEQLEMLSVNLQKQIDEQTKEIQKAYQVEKQARISLEELGKIKNQFILTTQHHLRTPLTIFKGFVQRVMRDNGSELSGRGKEYLDKALTAADRMNALVNEFLDIAQLEVGEAVLKMQPIRLEELIREAYDALISEAEHKGLRVDVEFTEAASKIQINADRQKLKIALLNLLDNAIKYTNHGSVAVRADVIVHPIERVKFIRLIVQDTGIGIKKEDLATLFDRYFQRGETAEKMYTTGRGLGLVLSKNIIEAHNGRLLAESSGENQGATFTVEIPVIE